MFRDTYDMYYFDYWLANNERLEDRIVNNKLAKAKVLLFFLVKKSYRVAKKPHFNFKEF